MVSSSALVPALIGVAVCALTAIAFIVYKAVTQRKAPDYDVEKHFWNPKSATGSKVGTFPSVFDEPSVTVSVIVPAYNEDQRMAPMMTEMLDFLEETERKDKKFTWEIIVVDDGSKDKTSAFANTTYATKYGADKFRVLRLFRNNGKGGAVRKGMVRARGRYLLMADADGATKASDLGRLMAELQKVERDGLGIAVGSRAHLEEAEGDAKAKRTPLRKLLMWGFHTLITLMIGNTQIKDTQCGFKLFTRATARLLFPVQHIDRWAFDVELLFLAARNRVPMVEVPVTWNEIEGSKLDVLTSTIQMARDIMAIRLCYMFGLWSDRRVESAPLATGVDAAVHVSP